MNQSPSDPLQDLRERARDPHATTEDLVLVGWRLWRLIYHAQALLEGIKATLRTVAIGARRGDQKRVTLEGSGGSTTEVVFSDPRLSVSKDFNVVEARWLLGAEFDLLFDLVPTLKESSPGVIEGMSQEKRDYLRRVLTVSTGTPRVSFQSLEGVEVRK